jgi:type IX secretion system PorP/SprF family membrane protein
MKKFLFISSVFFYLTASGQQIPQYSQWMWNLFAVNPAHVGLKPCLEIKSLYRHQYTNFDGAPRSGFLTFSTPIYTEKKKFLTPRQGAGFKFETDQFGPFSMNRFNLSYAGHFNFTPDTRLSIGISAGFRQWVFDKNKITTLVADPIVNESRSFISPDASAGFWWNGKNYFVGLSFFELSRSKWKINDSRFGLHSLLNAGFRIAANKQITILPYAIMRIPPKGPVSMDLNVIFSFQNKIDFGLGLRNKDAVIFLLQYKIKDNFIIAYSYDHVISSLGKNLYPSHELSFAFGTCRAKAEGKTICPLF